MMIHHKWQGPHSLQPSSHWRRALWKGSPLASSWGCKAFCGLGGLVPASLDHLWGGHVNKQPLTEPSETQMRTQKWSIWHAVMLTAAGFLPAEGIHRAHCQASVTLGEWMGLSCPQGQRTTCAHRELQAHISAGPSRHPNLRPLTATLTPSPTTPLAPTPGGRCPVQPSTAANLHWYTASRPVSLVPPVHNLFFGQKPERAF